MSRVAISVRGKTLEDPVDPRFGRCPNFVLVDPDTLEWSAIPNPGAGSGGGAGIQAAQALIDNGVDILVTGNVGPNAHSTLEGGGVEIFTGASGAASRALEEMKEGKLRATREPTSPAHHGGH